ncbi:MAG: 30S ribosomal protein S8 [Patescibacteria group bacterium]|jgi:small subunit ribosomal protein S8
MTDPISDMLTRIRNAVTLKKAEVVLPASKVKWHIAQLLEREHFIKKAEQSKDSQTNRPVIRLILKYQDGASVIQGLDRVSKPGRRIYQPARTIPRVLPSLGIQIISTSRGLMTNSEAKRQKLGGEVMCVIY